MIKTIELTNWRNQGKFKETLDWNTVIIGPNASGKTNILESIYYASILSSWRTHSDQDLLKWGEDYFEIKLETQNNNTDQVRIFIQPDEERVIKKIEINKISRTRKALSGILKTVLFSPEQIEFLTTPGGRRQYLNQFLSQKDYHYSLVLREYNKVVRSKNIILEKIQQGNSTKQELEFWNLKLTELAQIITDKRRDWFQTANTGIRSAYNLLTDKDEAISVEFYLKNPPEKLLETIHENLYKEIKAGITLYGPHRDDWGIILKNHELVKSGSRGEWRSVLIAIKLLEAEYLTEEEHKPIILLDDFLSELDEERKQNFFLKIKNYQVILTSAEKLPTNLVKNKWKIIKING